MSGCDFQKKKFSVPLGLSKQGQDNYNRIFRKSFWKRMEERIEKWIYEIFLERK